MLVLLNHYMWCNGFEPLCSIELSINLPSNWECFCAHSAHMFSRATLLVGWSFHPMLAVNWTKRCASLLTRCVIELSFPFMINGVPVVFDVRLKQDRSIHLTTLRFSSGTRPGEVHFCARPINDGYWSPSISHENDEIRPSSLWFSEWTEHCTRTQVNTLPKPKGGKAPMTSEISTNDNIVTITTILVLYNSNEQQ